MTIEEEISSHLDMKPRKIKAETKKKNRDNEIKIYVCTMDKNLYAYEFLYEITRYLIFPNLSSSKKKNMYIYNMSCICNSAGF